MVLHVRKRFRRQNDMEKYIDIKGARVNNLKNVSLKIPRNKFVVITGVSGSGKSSLAFDTLYAEGQRRYVESLSSYARQFLGRVKKPECDFIKGLPPAIAIEQKVIARNPRSTVGTTTEIYEYLRLLFARIGKTISPVSGEVVKKNSVEDIVECVGGYSTGTRFMVLAPVLKHEGRTLVQQLNIYIKEGYSRVLVAGEVMRIEDCLDKHETYDTEDAWLVIDRMSVDKGKEFISRLTDSVETAMFEGNGACRISFLPSNINYDFSTRFEADGIRFEEPSDNMFSFNSPVGACPECEGFGKVMGIDEKLVIPNTALSVYDGCVQCWHGEKMKMWHDEFCRKAAIDNFPIFKPYFELSRKEKDMLWHGLPCESHLDLENKVCIDSFFKMVSDNMYKIQYRVMMSRYRGKTTCPECHGTRLRKESLWVKVNGLSISDLVDMPVSKLEQWFDNLKLESHEEAIAKRLLAEIKSRLHFLNVVGLGYLTLNRASNSLSGGESQRINLTTSLGSSLIGSLYILDEPSIGLHSRDTDRLISVLKELRDIGNTVVVVEHDKEIMMSADEIIDVGPDAGSNGGEIVYQGCPPCAGDKVDVGNRSHTVDYLTEKEQIPVPLSRRKWNNAIMLKGCRMNNLKGIDVDIPLNVLCVITGVSGSGKSSLVKGILYPALKRRLDEVAEIPGEYLSMEGDYKKIHHVEFVDQNPIGKSSRSNPATYVKAYDYIRALFAEQPLAKQLGFTPQYFSFNAEGGRCEECKGAGSVVVEMQFMADIVLECDACHGQRFKRDVLDVRYKGKNINDILDMTVSEAISFFDNEDAKKKTSYNRAVIDRLKPLADVGLGYIKLGQNSSTMSGGENQRVKLAYFISLEKQTPTLFIFDEPTTGLHFHDISKLMKAFNALLERGHSIVVIEHNMEVIKCADWIIDLGPEGGDKGGDIVFAGIPDDIVECQDSLTGKHLRHI